MPYGAGVVAARQCGAAELVDPRPYAVGSIRGTFERYTHVTTLLPAMGYGDIQRHELEETINRTPCDVVVIATPVDLGHILNIKHPCVRVGYEIEEVSRPGVTELMADFIQKVEKHRLVHA
jgi:predicted GTPase